MTELELPTSFGPERRSPEWWALDTIARAAHEMTHRTEVLDSVRAKGGGWLPEVPASIPAWLRSEITSGVSQGESWERAAGVLREGSWRTLGLLDYARELGDLEARNAGRYATLVWAAHVVDGDETVAGAQQVVRSVMRGPWSRETHRWREVVGETKRLVGLGQRANRTRAHLALIACTFLDMLPGAWRSAIASAKYDPPARSQVEGDGEEAPRRRGARR